MDSDYETVSDSHTSQWLCASAAASGRTRLAALRSALLKRVNGLLSKTRSQKRVVVEIQPVAESGMSAAPGR